jgi:ribokinase
MNQPNLVVIGGASTDYIMRGERLPERSESTQADGLIREPGGKGVNQAIASARLGARVAFIGMLGDDRAGEYILSRLADEGVDIRHVRRHHEAPTGSTLIMVDKHGDTKRMAAAGANALLMPTDIMQAMETISHAELVLAQLEVPVAAIECAFRTAHARGLKTMLDAAPAMPLGDDLLRMTGVLRANAAEASRITGLAVDDEASAVRAASNLISRGVGIAALATGDGANLVVAGHSTVVLPHLAVDALDSTGAGDAYSATFAVALLEGQSPREAGFLASVAAAYATTRIGTLAGMPTRQQLVQFAQQGTDPI